MTLFFKINSENTVEFKNSALDLLTFILIIREDLTERGYVTCIATNRKRPIIKKRIQTLGMHDISPISQFAVSIETGMSSFPDESKVIGLNALKMHLDENRKKPFLLSKLVEICRKNLQEKAKTQADSDSDLDNDEDAENVI